MSKIIAAVAALLCTAVAVSAATAAEKTRKKKIIYQQQRPAAERIYSEPDANGWYPRDSRLLKFGSKIWWEQMEQEGRIGRREW